MDVNRSVESKEAFAETEHTAGAPGLAKVRHHLRTPINHILGFSEILLEDARGNVPEEFLRDLRKIHAGGDRLLRLIHEHLGQESFAAKPDLRQLGHELRTPVNHIIGYSELLMEQCEELGRPELQADLARINSAARTWLSLMEAHLIGSVAENPPAPGFAEPELASDSGPTALEAPLAHSPLQTRIGQARLLLADDDEANRELLCRRLEKLGHRVTAVSDGLQALDRLVSDQFDLVLLDLLMPNLDGREVLAQMKAQPALRDVPVVMISALDHLDGIVRCIELGAEDYISKPFSPVLLRARIDACLDKKRLRDREVSYLRQIQAEKQRSDDLLHIILPEDVAAELKATSRVQPRRFEDVGVLFCDIVEFTRYCDQHPAEEVLGGLQGVVEAFEQISAAHGLEKIKTIGDSFMGTIGLRTPAVNPAISCIGCGLDMIDAAARLPPHWSVRVGVHIGPVIAGVVGRRKYQYDVWGDTVNLAARMVEAAEPGKVCFGADIWRRLGSRARSQPIGRIEVKGKGPLDLFLIG